MDLISTKQTHYILHRDIFSPVSGSKAFQNRYEDFIQIVSTYLNLTLRSYLSTQLLLAKEKGFIENIENNDSDF